MESSNVTRILLHNTRLMPTRLILAFLLSFALHGMLLFPGLLKRFAAAAPPPVLQATLRPPPKRESVPEDPILKDTLAEDEAKPVAKPRPPAPKPAPMASSRREVQAAQRKLSQHLFYPAEAVERGIEGEVRLILKLSAEGRVLSVAVGSGSGYSVLDNAAVRAAYAMGNLGGGEARELIVPVIFRLQ